MTDTGDILLLYLDRYHLEDVLFLKLLGKRLAGMPLAQPKMIVHGSGEAAEQLLGTEQARTFVERSIRQANQKVVAALTDSLVAAVSVQGTDRNLVVRNEAKVVLRHPSWLLKIMQKGVIPVISSLSAASGDVTPEEVDMVDLLPAFAGAFEVPLRVLLFSRDNRPGWFEGQECLDSIRISQTWPEKAPPELEGMRPVISAGLDVVLSSPDGLSASGEIHGTRILR